MNCVFTSAPGYAMVTVLSLPTLKGSSRLRTHSYLVASTILCPRKNLTALAFYPELNHSRKVVSTRNTLSP